MPITLNSLTSYAKRAFPALFGTIGTPGTLTIGDTDWTPSPAAIAALNDMIALPNGNILMGVSGTSALTNPTTGPTLTPGTGGSLALGSYEVVYSYRNTFGETLVSSPTTITLSGGQNRIVPSAITPPSGASVNWYITDPDLTVFKFHSNNSGASFNINSVSGTSGAVPGGNTTASADHAEKGIPTGSSGIVVTTSAGGLDFGYSPAAHNSQNGYYLRELRIENFADASLPTLTGTDKGRLAFGTTTGQLNVWDGAAWIPLGASTGISGSAGGDLGLTYPNPKVVKLQGYPLSSTAPTTGQTLVYDGSQWAPAAGVSSNATSIRGKNVTTTAPTPNQALIFNGTSWAPTDIVPTSGNATSVGSIPLSGTPSVGQVLVFNGTNWVPSDIIAVDGNATTIAGFPVDTSTPTTNQAYVFNGSSFVPTTVETSPAPDATTSVKGIVKLAQDLGGTAALPTVLGLQGTIALSGTAAAGNVLTATGPSAAHWAAPAGGGGGSGGAVQNKAVNGAFGLDGSGDMPVLAGTTSIAPMWFLITDSTDLFHDAILHPLDTTTANSGLPYIIQSFMEINIGSSATDSKLYFRVENLGFNKARKIAVSFYAKSLTGSSHVLGLRSHDNVDTASTGTLTFTPTSTWARQSILFTLKDPATYDDRSLLLELTLPHGANVDFYITGVQVETSDDNIVGGSTLDITAAGRYTRPRDGDEAAAVNRWYVTSLKSFTNGLLSTYYTPTTDGAFTYQASVTGTTTQLSPTLVLPSEMKSVPTVEFLSVDTTGVFEVYNETRSQHCSSTTAIRKGVRSFVIQCTGSSSTVPGDVLSVHWRAYCDH